LDFSRIVVVSSRAHLAPPEMRASAPRPDFQYYQTVATKTVPKPKLQLLHSEKLAKLPWLVHAFSTRCGGVSRPFGGSTLNLGFTKQDTRAAVERNRALFLKQLGITNARTLITLQQIHSDLIHRTEAVPERTLAGDGLITNTPGLLLAILTADCLPIILVDKKNRAVGVFHAGWRGTVKRIVEKGVGEMQRYFGSDPRNMIAAIGPGVQACCYQVGEEVRQKFEAQFSYATELFREVKESDPVREKYPMLFLTARAPGHSELPVNLFLNLVEANRRQLIDAGVPAKNIDASSPCTACHTDLLFSHRAEKGVTGRSMAVVGVRKR
jgi:YfiH family protein